MRSISTALLLLLLAAGSLLRAQEAESPRLAPVDMPAKKILRESIDRAVSFLLQDQNRDGSWGLPTRTKDLNIYAPIPGAHHAFRVGTTALSMMGLGDAAPDDPRVRLALERAEAWLIDYLPRLRRATPAAIYNVWGHAYAIQALVRMHRRGHEGTRGEMIQRLIRLQIDYLVRYESVNGGWGYYDFSVGARKPASSSTSFASATVLVALWEAKVLGIAAPPRLVSRAIRSIQRQRKPDFSYLYSDGFRLYPMASINRPGGSLARSQACNAALRLWRHDSLTDGVLETWLHRLYARNGWLSIGRKRPVPHETWFQVSGYFYYYGHYYARICIELLPRENQSVFWAHQATTLLALQEKDGSFWDYPLYDYHQPYGTGYALLALAPALSFAP